MESNWDNDEKMNDWLRVHYHTFLTKLTPAQMVVKLADQVLRTRKCSEKEAYIFAEKFLKGVNMTLDQQDELIRIADERGKKLEKFQLVIDNLNEKVDVMKKELISCTHNKALEQALHDEVIGLRAVVKHLEEHRYENS